VIENKSVQRTLPIDNSYLTAEEKEHVKTGDHLPNSFIKPNLVRLHLRYAIAAATS
jgi:hypothetical protein